MSVWALLLFFDEEMATNMGTKATSLGFRRPEVAGASSSDKAVAAAGAKTRTARAEGPSSQSMFRALELP
jgi:hypothetical protein